MQSIEQALKKVFDFIGNDYDLPQGEFLNNEFLNGTPFRNPYFGQTPKAVKFGFGTQKELNIWLSESKEKYPLVWLVYPIKESYNNDAGTYYSYEKVRLIFAENNDVDKLVETRVQTTRFVLDQLTQKFAKLMRQSQFVKFIRTDKKTKIIESFEPNYSVNEQKTSGTIAVWDAITFDCAMVFNPKCMK